MVRSRLDVAASAFISELEVLHTRFLQISQDPACGGCQSAGFGEAILAAWLQTKWADFTRDLIVASALGTRRRWGTSVRAAAGVRSRLDAERMVKTAAASASHKLGFLYPVWHSPVFAIEVGTLIGVNNLPQLEVALGATSVPRQVTDFRNYLVHPGERTRQRYESLQFTLGMHRMEPEEILHQQREPGLTVFAWWVRELQQLAAEATR